MAKKLKPDKSSTGMDEKLKTMECETNELDELTIQEEKILTRLIELSKDHLKGVWKYNSSYNTYKIKLKVNGYHFLSKGVNSFSKGLNSITLIKSTIIHHGRVDPPTFQNDTIAQNWKEARQFISLTQVIDEAAKQINIKMKEAQKVDLNEIEKKLSEAI